MDVSDGDSNDPSLSEKAVSAALGAFLGTAIGGPVGGIVGAGLGPALEPAVMRVFGELRLDTRRRASRVLEVAAHAGGVSVEEFVERILATEKSRLLAGIAIEAATRTVYEAKVRALGRALAAGLLEDEAKVDTPQLLVRALADLEPPHISLLELITRRFLRNGQLQLFDPSMMEPDGIFRPGPRLWTPDKVRDARPRLAPVLPVLVGALLRHGLVAEVDRVARALENYNDAYARKANEALTRGRPAKAVRLERGTLRNGHPACHLGPDVARRAASFAS